MLITFLSNEMMHGGTEAGKLFNWTSEQGGKRNQFGNIIAEMKTCLS